MKLPGRSSSSTLTRSHGWPLKLLVVFMILFASAVWAGCSIAEDYETLSFWFDGVPTVEELEAKRLEDIRIAEAEVAGPLTSAERAALLAVRVNEVFTSNHQPVEEKRCTECHVMAGAKDANEMGWMSDLPELIVPAEELCLRCHEPPRGTYTHGPAASGNCYICHQSHTSLYPHLVRVKRAETLCNLCHDQKEFLDQEVHEENKSFDCIACHDPHASEHEYLLHTDYPRISPTE